MNASTFFNNPHHTSQVFSTSPQSSSGHVYTTEVYPPSLLPFSTDSSPMESPILLPRRVPSFSNDNDHFTLDGSGNNNNNVQQQREFGFPVPSVVNNNQRVIKRKASRASMRSNRNSIFLDPIVEESTDFSLVSMNDNSATIVGKH